MQYKSQAFNYSELYGPECSTRFGSVSKGERVMRLEFTKTWVQTVIKI